MHFNNASESFAVLGNFKSSQSMLLIPIIIKQKLDSIFQAPVIHLEWMALIQPKNIFSLIITWYTVGSGDQTHLHGEKEIVCVRVCVWDRDRKSETEIIILIERLFGSILLYEFCNPTPIRIPNSLIIPTKLLHASLSWHACLTPIPGHQPICFFVPVALPFP